MAWRQPSLLSGLVCTSVAMQRPVDRSALQQRSCDVSLRLLHFTTRLYAVICRRLLPTQLFLVSYSPLAPGLSAVANSQSRTTPARLARQIQRTGSSKCGLQQSAPPREGSAKHLPGARRAASAPSGQLGPPRAGLLERPADRRRGRASSPCLGAARAAPRATGPWPSRQNRRDNRRPT